MSPAKKKAKTASKSCKCGHGCHDKHSKLPGYLLMAFGLLSLPFNFAMVEGFEWLRAWPLFLVLLGAVFVVRVFLCKKHS